MHRSDVLHTPSNEALQTRRTLDSLHSWGPFGGDMSNLIFDRLHKGRGTNPVCIITGGSAVCLLLDAVQECCLSEPHTLAPMYLAFTCRDAKLFCWIARLIMLMLTDQNARQLNEHDIHITVNLSDMGGKIDRTLASVKFDKSLPREKQGAEYKEFIEYKKALVEVPKFLENVLTFHYGRLRFSDVAPEYSEVFFSGSSGLLKAVQCSAEMKHWKVHHGPTFDQDTNSSSSLHKYLPLECCRRSAKAKQPDLAIDLSSVVADHVSPDAPATRSKSMYPIGTPSKGPTRSERSENVRATTQLAQSSSPAMPGGARRATVN